MRARMRHLLAEQQREVSFASKGIALIEQHGFVQRARAILPVKLHDLLHVSERSALAAMTPERRVETRVETVMQRKEIADVVPHLVYIPVGDVLRGLSRAQLRVLQATRQADRLRCNHPQRRGLKRLDET